MKLFTKLPTRSVLAWPALALLFPLTGLSGENLDETRDLTADGHVLVENLAGSVEVTVWDKAKIEIKGELGDDVEKVEISATGNGIQIRVKNKQNAHNIDGTDLYLRVPLAASIEVETISADIEMNGSAGESIVLNTVSGDVEAQASPQRLEIQSVSGEVDFVGSTSRSSVETVSGDISLSGGVHGEIEISTVSGDVSLIAEAVDRGRFESVSGDMKLDLAINDNGRLASESMSGDLILRLPAAQQAGFEVQTYSGDIRSDFGESARVSRGPGSALKYSEGNNGALIRLESFSGDIQIRRQ
jgi:DUF4097 and DUF4098 domain-containing protein YvlB